MSHPCRRLLVVEDDTDLREALLEFLTDEGVEALVARDGDEALAILERRPRPDTILLDLTMPGLSGTGVLEHLAADPELSRIPVAVMSGLGPRHYSYLPHVDAFLVKPFDLARLNAVLSSLCARRAAVLG